MDENIKVPIKAKDAKIGGTYVTEMNRVVTLVDIHRFGDGEDDISGVTLRGKGSSSPIIVSAATILYEHSGEEIPVVSEDGMIPEKIKKEKIKKEPKPKKEASMKAKKEPKLKMSHIMNEMIFAGKDPEEIADAVIAAFPDQAQDRKKLVGLIKGPRIWNLKKRYPERFATHTDEVTTDSPQPGGPTGIQG